MKARQARAAIAMTKDAVLGDDSSTSWIQISESGSWAGHDAGEFTLGRAEFSSAIDAFLAQKNPIVVDYEHSSTALAPEGAPAAGWILDLEARGDEEKEELWAFVEWTEKAADRIRAKEYRFVSPVWMFDAPHRVSGEELLAELHSLALTNTPFLDGMAPVELSRLRGAQNQELRNMVTELQEESPEVGEAPEEEGAPGLEAVAEMLLAGLELEDPMDLLGMVESNLEALLSVLVGEPSEEEESEQAEGAELALDVALSRNAELEQRVTDLAAEIERFHQVEAEAEADEAIACGRASSEQRDSLVKLYRTDRELFESLVSARPAMTPPGRVIKGTELNRDSAVLNDDNNAQVMELRRALGWTEERAKKALARVAGGERGEI